MKMPLRRTVWLILLGCSAGLAPVAIGGGTPIEIKLDVFAREWKADAQATRKKYGGKTVTFTGPVVRFGIDITGKPMLGIRCEAGEYPTCLSAYTSEATPWAVYGIGQTLTIKGVFNASLGAVVENSTVTARTKNTTLTVKATDLAADAIPSRDAAAKKYMDQGIVVVGEVAKINDRKDIVFLRGKADVLIECRMYSVVQTPLAASLTVGQEARLIGLVQEQPSPILDETKNFRLRDCFPLTAAKKK